MGAAAGRYPATSPPAAASASSGAGRRLGAAGLGDKRYIGLLKHQEAFSALLVLGVGQVPGIGPKTHHVAYTRVQRPNAPPLVPLAGADSNYAPNGGLFMLHYSKNGGSLPLDRLHEQEVAQGPEHYW